MSMDEGTMANEDDAFTDGSRRSRKGSRGPEKGVAMIVKRTGFLADSMADELIQDLPHE
jgi:hypothetical protein